MYNCDEGQVSHEGGRGDATPKYSFNITYTIVFKEIVLQTFLLLLSSSCSRAIAKSSSSISEPNSSNASFASLSVFEGLSWNKRFHHEKRKHRYTHLPQSQFLCVTIQTHNTKPFIIPYNNSHTECGKNVINIILHVVFFKLGEVTPQGNH